MTQEYLYHGASGDRILGIIVSGEMRPDADGQVFFAREGFSSVFMHGGDLKRRAAFAIKLRARLPKGATIQRGSTSGVQDTYIVVTAAPLAVEVLELYVRERPGQPVVTICGAEAIAQYLRSRQGPTGGGARG